MSKKQVYQLDYLEEYFKTESTREKRRIMVSALRKSAEPMAAEMRNQVSATGGGQRLYRSIGITTMRRRTQEGNPIVKVGARVEKGYKGYLGATFEFGTKERRRRNNAATGKITATQWFSKAVSKTIDHCVEIVRGEWYNSIERFIKRQERKLKK